jgi:hypothetical protein
MRLFPILLFITFGYLLQAQSTLVQTAANETFDLSCPTCKVNVTDIALVRGHQVMPFNLRKSPPANLLHWRYFDKFLNRISTYPRPLYGEDCTQLLDDILNTDTISLHINLVWTTDSVDTERKLFLLIGGLQKRDLSSLPLVCGYSDEVKSTRRFASIAQVAGSEGGQETYEITDGTVTIDRFDPKSNRISGTFEFTGDRVGIVKTGIFNNGAFVRE